MNHEKLWNDFKVHLVREAKKMERGSQYISMHKELLAHMAVMEAEEYGRASAGCCGMCEPDKNAGRKEPEKKPDQNRKPEPKEILRKVFGNDYADSLVDLGKKLNEKGRKFIVIDSGLELTDHILDVARERGIGLMKCACREIRKVPLFGFPIFRDIF